MVDGIIVAVVVVAAFLGLRHMVKHFAGKSGCCGSADYKPKRKKLSDVKCEQRFKVMGMHCEHCKARVEETINDISGLAGRVNLADSELTVLSEGEIDEALIKAKLERLGYTVEKIVDK